MGGWMDYVRFRNRNGLRVSRFNEATSQRQRLIAMDLDRMERDYLAPEYPSPPFAVRVPGSDPTARLAQRCGVDEATVRRVLAALFEVDTNDAEEQGG